MPIASSPPAGFQQQFQQFMYYAGPLVQIIFWVGILAIALLAYLQFKRLVDAKVAALAAGSQAGRAGVPEGGAIISAQAGSTPAGADDISVDDFAD